MFYSFNSFTGTFWRGQAAKSSDSCTLHIPQLFLHPRYTNYTSVTSCKYYREVIVPVRIACRARIKYI